MNRKERRRRQSHGLRATGPGGAAPSPAAAAFAQAGAAFQAGRMAESEALLRQTLRLDPAHAEAHNWLGVVCQQRGDARSALQHLRKAVALAPGSAEFVNNLGITELKLEDFDAARRSFEKAAALNPRLAQAHHNLGLVFQKRRELDQAIVCFRRAIALAPNFANAYLNLGNALNDLGRLDEAIDQYRTAIRIAPKQQEARHNLVTALNAAQKHDEAMAEAEQAIALDPNAAQAHDAMGLVLMAQRRFDEAAKHFERAIALDPGYARAHSNLGQTFLRRRDANAALPHLQQAVALDPGSADAHLRLGTALNELGYFEQAADHLRRALALRPDDAAVHTQLGNVLNTLDESEEAMHHLRRALALAPDRADVHTALGVALASQGKFDESRAAHDKAISLNPASAGSLFHRTEISKRYRTESEAERLEALLTGETMPPPDKAVLHFALGRIYDTLKDSTRSFAHYRQANELVHADLPFDRQAHRANVDALIETFTADFFAERRSLGNDSRLPVFIFGMPRSGTTLVEQILSAHPLVGGGGELLHFHRITTTLKESFGFSADYPKGAAEIGGAQASEISGYYLRRLQEKRPGCARVTDKLPANFMHLGLMALLFPKAAFIHCRRDPMDTCLSCYFLTFAKPHPYAYDLEDLGFYYREYQRLMAHWRKVLPLPILEVDYEETVADQEAVSRRLIAHCGLEWDDRCLAFHESDRPVQTASVWQVRQPIYKTSVARWRNYERFLGPLREALGESAEGQTERK